MTLPHRSILEAVQALVALLLSETGSLQADRAGQQAQAGRPLSDTEKSLLDVLGKAEKPLKGSSVAARAGLSYGSHVRAALAGLVRAGLLVHARRGGYWPAGRPEPDAHDD